MHITNETEATANTNTRTTVEVMDTINLQAQRFSISRNGQS